MDSYCRFVLKQLQTLTKDIDSYMAIVSNYPIIRLTGYSNVELDFTGTKAEKELKSIIDYLIELGYLKQGYNKYTFSLTHKGLHPYEVVWQEIKSFLLKSILVPVVVSTATTLLTLWLKKL